MLVNLDLTSSCSPYIDDTDDFFACIAQWCTVMILLCTVALQTGAITPDAPGLGILFMLLLFAVIVFYVGYAMLYAWEDIRNIPEYILNVRKCTARKVVAEAGEDPSPANGEYFPEYIPEETIITKVNEGEMGIIEEGCLQKSIQAPNQKYTEEADYSCLDKLMPEYGLDINLDMDKNEQCKFIGIKENSGISDSKI